MEAPSRAMAAPAAAGSSPMASDRRCESAGSGAARAHGKRALAGCHIEAHTIQKAASPKKKALDPLRYMPDRAAFFALFTVAVRFEDGKDAADSGAEQPACRVFRTYKQFSALHSRVRKMYPKSNLPRELPSMRKKRYDNDYIEQKRQELNEYLATLLRAPEVRSSKLLREFLEDTNLSDDSDVEDGGSVPSKILEGLPGTIVTVRAGQSFSLSLPLVTAGDVASWQFVTKKHSIGFSVSFNGHVVKPYAREESTAKAIKGNYRCAAPGTCTLDWDNTYTWSKAKVLVYWAEVEKKAPSVAASPAAGSLPSPVSTTKVPSAFALGSRLPPMSPSSGSDVSDRSWSMPIIDRDGTASPRSDDADRRRSGYIAQTRNRSMYPRRIVNSSISLITKPFVSGSTRNRAKDEQIKSGSLIVERSVKFRGRHWYRKWFVLDTRKCLLRYYESEVAAQRGLSQAKLNLNNKHASLAITSSIALDSAPTPYMFVVRTRTRCWKICAASSEEYTAWEHAISTAIFAAQLSREARAEKKRQRKRGKSGDSSEDGLTEASGAAASKRAPRSSAEEDEDDDEDDDDSKGDDDNDSEESEDEEGDATGDEELPRISEDEALVEDVGISTRDGIIQVEAFTTSSATVLGDKLSLDLRNLPLQWKLALVATLNCMLLALRWTPTLLIVLLLLAVDWHLMLRFMRKSWREKLWVARHSGDGEKED